MRALSMRNTSTSMCEGNLLQRWDLWGCNSDARLSGPVLSWYRGLFACSICELITCFMQFRPEHANVFFLSSAIIEVLSHINDPGQLRREENGESYYCKYNDQVLQLFATSMYFTGKSTLDFYCVIFPSLES